MNTFENDGGKYKSGMRRIALNHGRTNGKWKTVLLLPGPQQTCIKESLSLGLIDRNTFVIAVEKDEATAKAIETFLKANFKRYHLHVGNIYNFNLSGLLASYGLKGLDYAYVDLCGQLTDKILMWIRQELCHFCESMSFTFSINVRQNNLIQRILLPILRGTANWPWTLKRLKRMCARGANFNLNHQDDAQRATAYGLSLGLRNGFGLEGWFPYRDKKTPMALVLVSGKRERDNNDDVIAESIECDEVPKWFIRQSITEKLTPAQKAWVTRRRRV